MPRYIDADKVVKWSYSEPRYSDSVNDRTDLRDFLLSLPTLSLDDVRGVVFGTWLRHQQGRWVYVKCSRCETVHDVKSNYCPNCGAKIEEVN